LEGRKDARAPQKKSDSRKKVGGKQGRTRGDGGPKKILEAIENDQGGGGPMDKEK